MGAAAVAVLLTVLSLLGGKYAAVKLAVRGIDAAIPAFNMEDEDVKIRMADISIRESGQDPSMLKFRNGTSFETAESLKDYPPKIAKGIEKSFKQMSVEEIETVKEEAEAEYDQIVSAFESEATKRGFADSFSAFDILFFLLGIFTAGKVALSDVIDGSND